MAPSSNALLGFEAKPAPDTAAALIMSSTAHEQEFGAVECLEILRVMRHGAMQPLLCRADDGVLYVVKPFSSGGSWALLMEWIGARMGRSLGLPIPNYRRVQIGEDLAEAWNAANTPKIEPGPGFGSQYVDSATEPAEALLAELDPALARRLLAFDWWIHNKDRTFKNPNLLWSAVARCFHVIDHDQAGQPDGAELFWNLHICAGLRAGEPLWLPDDLRREFRSALALRQSILSELPSAWTSCGEDVASFFTQLERTLDDDPHQHWRTYD
jgi:hypothetical protein